MWGGSRSSVLPKPFSLLPIIPHEVGYGIKPSAVPIAGPAIVGRVNHVGAHGVEFDVALASKSVLAWLVASVGDEPSAHRGQCAAVCVGIKVAVLVGPLRLKSLNSPPLWG